MRIVLLCKCVFFCTLCCVLSESNAQVQLRQVQGVITGEVRFRQNTGQWGDSSLFKACNLNNSAEFYSDRVEFKHLFASEEGVNLHSVKYLKWSVKPLSSNEPEITGFHPGPSNIHYFNRGNIQGTSTSDFLGIRYRNVYRSIDFNYYFTEDNCLKYDVVIHPGGDVKDITLLYDGVSDLTVDEEGNLSVIIGENIVKESGPIAFQFDDNGNKMYVKVCYKIIGERLAFEIFGSYDSTLDLVIDPLYLAWSSYFYGDKAANNDVKNQRETLITDLSYDAEGNYILTGETTEYFNLDTNVLGLSFNGGRDAFICKLSASLDSVLFLSYFGGNRTEARTRLIVLDSNAGFIIAGETYSANLPVSAGAFDTDTPKWHNDTYDAKSYLAHISSSGQELFYCTYLGGDTSNKGSVTVETEIWAMDHHRGKIYLAGLTTARDYPVTVGALQVTHGGEHDVFVTLINLSDYSIEYSTFLGGKGSDIAADIIVAETGAIYLTGITQSTDFPTSPGYNRYFNKQLNGKQDGFIVMLDSTLAKIERSRMIGGSGMDHISMVTRSNSGDVFLVGWTESSDFPCSPQAFMSQKAGESDIVVVNLNAGLSAVHYATYVGGNGREEFIDNYGGSTKVGCNIRGELFVAGRSSSTDFPVTPDALIQKNFGATWYLNKDNWVLQTTGVIFKLSRKGDKVLYGTYWGGMFHDQVTYFHIKNENCTSILTASGITSSIDFTTTKGAIKDTALYQSSRDSFNQKTCNRCWVGFISVFYDSLQSDSIDLHTRGDTLFECDVVYQYLDIGNYGADIHWTRGLEGSEVILRDTGWYHVWATYGCDTVSDSVYVLLGNSPKVDLGKDTIYCDHFPSLTLDAGNVNSAVGYSWSNGSTNQTLSIDKPGKYWVEVKTDKCGSTSDTIYFGLDQTPEIDNKDTSICNGVPINLDAGFTSLYMNYHWSNGATTRQIEVLDSSTLQLKMWSSCGEDSAQISIHSRISPIAHLSGDTVFCDSVNLSLIAGALNNGETYLWFDPETGTSLGTENRLHLLNPAFLVLEINNSCGSDRDSMSVDVVYSTWYGRRDTLFACDSVNTLLRPHGSEFDQYMWSDGSNSDTLFINSAGVYTVWVENACGIDSNIWWVFLKQKPRPRLLNDSTFCDNISVLLDATIDDVEAVYLWQDNSRQAVRQVSNPGLYSVTVTNICGEANEQVQINLLHTPKANLGADTAFCDVVPQRTIEVGSLENDETYLWWNGWQGKSILLNQEGLYWVEISNPCGIDRDSVYYSILQIPEVDIGPDTFLCDNFPYTLDAGNPGSKYLWQPGGEVGQFKHAHDYGIFKVTVTNSDGCAANDEVQIFKNCHSYYFIPTAFSPNNDGVNDVFGLIANDINNYECTVFNRWGELLFHSNDPQYVWDGTFRDEHVQNDIYFFRFKFTLKESREDVEQVGRIHLLR